MRKIGLGIAAAGLLAMPFALDLRLKATRQPLTDAWQAIPVGASAARPCSGLAFARRRSTRSASRPDRRSRSCSAIPFSFFASAPTGIASNRPREPSTRASLIGRSRPRKGRGEADYSLCRRGQDLQLSGVLRAGPRSGAPDAGAPARHPGRHPSLFAAAIEFVSRVVDRYKSHPAVVAWQVENEAVDPLGFEHSWRLAAEFIGREVEAVRRADPSRPILLNGFFPAP